MKLFLLNLIVFFTVAAGIAADIFGKTWTFNRRISFFLVAFLLYAFSGLFWLFWLQYARLSIAVTWWVALGELCAILVGIFYFHEKVTAFEFIAMALIFSGVLILGLQEA